MEWICLQEPAGGEMATHLKNTQDLSSDCHYHVIFKTEFSYFNISCQMWLSVKSLNTQQHREQKIIVLGHSPFQSSQLLQN